MSVSYPIMVTYCSSFDRSWQFSFGFKVDHTYIIGHIVVSEKIKTNLKRENTQEGGGELGLKKCKHNKFKQKKDKYKEI